MIYVLGGGGQSKGPVKKGTIGVKYPAGATCTVSNGSDTYTALDTSGAAAFIVEPGTWTVKATPADGGDPVSQSVTVAAGGWVEVELELILYIFKAGSGAVVPMAGGNNSSGSYSIDKNYISLTKSSDANGNAGVLTTNKIEISKYSTIYFETKCTSQYSSYGASEIERWARTVGIYSNNDYTDTGNSGTAYARLTADSTERNYTVDISAITGSYYVGSKGIGSADIYNIWLK